MTPSGHSRDGARQPARPSVPCAGRASVSSSMTIRGNRVHVPETGALWARSGFVPASPWNDPFSSFPTFRSRRDFSKPDGRLLRLELSTANHIDPFPPGGAIPSDGRPAREAHARARGVSLPRERPCASTGREARAADAVRREPASPARAGGSSATGRRTPTRGRSSGTARGSEGTRVQETAARLFPARGFAALSQPKAPSFRESVAKPADSALNNPKGARIEKVHRTAAPEIVQPGADVP